MERKQFVSRLEIKLAVNPEAETEAKSFTGYGAYFNNEDSYGDIIVPGAFTASIAKHAAAGTMPLMLFNHDAWHTLPAGVWKSMKEDEHGLLVEGELLDTTLGQDVYKALKAGAISGLSIGFYCTGYENEKGVRKITEADLKEISIVTFPANDLARVADVKSEDEDTDEALKVTLAKAGFSQEAVEALFASRANEEEPEEVSEDAESEQSEDEAKYDWSVVLAAIQKSVETTKEMYVR
ncbi:HK97 family phage prohead protease [Sphingomonas sp. HITSZ_GF]|uniref:HK97 family phage prohead protease n=1 Tax=Sphingomonas sp. HITSZ_GF TaxID=3037247 RepID=UPI00240D8B05|nr:HK97 family phage prohead protease [Sphingomonas sp. HITSZ_GF]MDG2532065.1 HK97 family phage prohead protease [Sphingomonas sp. HITSZ_GF]